MKKILALLMMSTVLSNVPEVVAQENLEGKLDSTLIETVLESSINDIESEPRYGTTINFGMSGGYLCTGDTVVAAELGYFDDLGVDIEFVNTQEPLHAVGTGKIDFTTSHIAEMMVPMVNGINATFVVPAQTGCKSLYVLDNGKINNTQDLIEKTIAVPEGIGTSDHNIVLRFLNKDNINPNQVNFKPVDSAAVIQAMQNGEIDAVILGDQFAEGFVNEGIIKSIRSITTDDDFNDEPCCVSAFNTDFVEDNPELARRIAIAKIQARHYIASHIEEATEILFKWDYASGDFDQAVRMMESYDWEVSQVNTEEALREVAEDYKAFGILDTELSADEIVEQLWTPLEITDEWIAENIISY